MRPALPILLAGALSCADAPAPPEVALGATGVTLTADDGIVSARLIDPAGVPVLTRRAPAPVDTLELRHLWAEAGTYRLDVQGTRGQWTLSLPVEAPARGEVRVEAPVGEQRQRVTDGEDVPLTVLGAGAASTCAVVGTDVPAASTTHRAWAVAVNVVASVTAEATTAVMLVCAWMPGWNVLLLPTMLACAQYALYVMPNSKPL